VTEAIACPADHCVGLRFDQPSAWAMKSAGLGVVANGLIGDDGATKRAKGLQRIYWLILCRFPTLELV
jgi:hypothetical protein